MPDAPSQVGGSRWDFAARNGHLILSAAALSVWFRVRGRRVPFSRLAEPLRKGATRPGAVPRGAADERTLRRAVAIATRWGPLRTTCLVRALTLATLMRRAGLPACVEVGIAPEGARAGRWFAHAWVAGEASRAAAQSLELARLVPRGPAGRRLPA